MPQGVTLVYRRRERCATVHPRSDDAQGVSHGRRWPQGRSSVAFTGFVSPLLPFVAADAAPPPGNNGDAKRAFWQITAGQSARCESYQLLSRPVSRTAPMPDWPGPQMPRLIADTGRCAAPEQDEDALAPDPRPAAPDPARPVADGVRHARDRRGVRARAAAVRFRTGRRRNGYAATGFLTEDQIARLSAQADRRAAELEAEAATRQAEEERLDRAYWAQTGARGTEAGLRAYLRRYPGRALCRSGRRAAGPDRGGPARAGGSAGPRRPGTQARSTNSAASYRTLSARLPARRLRGGCPRTDRGPWRTEAVTNRDREVAARAEAALNLPPIARNLIEVRLDQMGLKPGASTAAFDDDTRRAMRNFQQARGLPMTGYLDQAVVAQLLSGGIIRFGD